MKEIPVLPDDLETPDKPNGIDLKDMPITRAERLPFDPAVDDPWTTLPGDPQKYELITDEWRAVPLNKGVYKVISKEKGQVVYIAEDAKGTGTLRVTKEFNIETTGRTAVYLRGQSDLDSAIADLTRLLASKADKESVYTKEETIIVIDERLNARLEGFTNLLNFKGVVENEAALESIKGQKVGDTYQATDTGDFFTWVETPSPSWERLSGSIVDLSGYYTKGEVDLALAGKGDKAALDTLTQRVDILFLRRVPFDYVENEDPAKKDDDKTEVGEVWFKKDTGEIFIRKLSEIDQTKYWLNSTDNLVLKLGRQFVKLESDQTIKGTKTFTENIKSAKQPTANEDLVNKKYVDDLLSNISGGGASLPIENIVTIRDIQTITGDKTFQGKLEVANSPTSDNEVANKYYVDDEIRKITQSPLPGYVTTNTEQEITGLKTFNSDVVPKLKNYEAGVFNDDNFVTQKRVKELIQDGGGTEIALENLAKLNAPNDFLNLNTFRQGVVSVAPILQMEKPTEDGHLTTKSYVDELVRAIDIPSVDLSNYVTLNSTQTITGEKTFGGKTLYTLTPTDGTELVNKLYVDTEIGKLSGGGTSPVETEARLLQLNTDYSIAPSGPEEQEKGSFTITFLKDIVRNVIALNQSGEEVFINKTWDISDKVKLSKCYSNVETISLIAV